MTFPRHRGKERICAQCHPPAFQEALLIGMGETLQLDWRDPRSHAELSKQEFPDALEERSLHDLFEPPPTRIDPPADHQIILSKKKERLYQLSPAATATTSSRSAGLCHGRVMVMRDFNASVTSPLTWLGVKSFTHTLSPSQGLFRALYALRQGLQLIPA